MSDKKATVSFGFSKKNTSKVIKLENNHEGDPTAEEKDYVLAISDNEIKGTKQKPKKKEYVVPLLGARKPGPLTAEDLKAVNLEDKEAVKQILEDAEREKKRWEERGTKKETQLVIPVAKTTDGSDLLPDHEQIPLEEFGEAMLKGMGWNKTKGIGKTPKVVQMYEVANRPKGLGLGAGVQATATAMDKESDDDEEDKLTMSKGTYCHILHGKHKDLFAQIEGIDEDNSRVIVRITLYGESVTISQRCIELVTPEHYKKYSKYLNKGQSDKHKPKDKSRDSKHRRDEDHNDNRQSKHRSDEDHNHDRESKHRREDDHNHDNDGRTHSTKTKSGGSREHRSTPVDGETVAKKHRSEEEEEFVEEEEEVRPWLYTGLRVRIIDERYKNGKYYNSKAIIEDVTTPRVCVLRTSSGQYLEDMKQSQLETIIPRSTPANVMVLTGEYKGQFGKFLKKDRDSERAVVQLLEQSETILTLGFDSVCEYSREVID